MTVTRYKLILMTTLIALVAVAVAAQDVPTSQPMEWRRALRQKAPWYATDAATAVADQVLLYQKANGGWEKNIDMAKPLSSAERKALTDSKSIIRSTTIDNGATVSQLRFLSKIVTARSNAKLNAENYRTAFISGLDYLFAAQYPNGGFPQYFPLRKGYYTHITFNDGAMIGVLELLRDITKKTPDLAFVDDARRQKALVAVEKGTEVILKTQIVSASGIKTVWCAQHDENTLAPAAARKYELPTLSGGESVGIVRFLMAIEKPSAAVQESIKAAVKWFESVRIEGIRVEDRPLASAPKGFDRVVVEDKSAPPVWARFYEMKTNRPIFVGRDEVVKFSLAEIDIERRTGYSYYTEAPRDLLTKDYPAWLARIAPK